VSISLHLNGGDAGLKRFFERVHYGKLVLGGTVVLEAQPRELYIKARKLHPVWIVRPSYEDGIIRFVSPEVDTQTLQIQPDGFETVLCSIGFEPAQGLGEPGEGRA
jgi:7SK snRNA methylphosphate capping enzyme